MTIRWARVKFLVETGASMGMSGMPLPYIFFEIIWVKFWQPHMATPKNKGLWYEELP